MDWEWIQSVFSRPTAAASVDMARLSQFTRPVGPEECAGLDWGGMRQLHILGTANQPQADQVLPGCYLDARGQGLLVIGMASVEIGEYIRRCGTSLRRLTVRFTTAQALDISALTGLDDLDLSCNDRLRRVDGLERLTHLRVLRLYNTPLDQVLDLTPYEKLWRADLSRMPLRQIRLDRPLEELLELELSGTRITDASFLEKLPRADAVGLTGTQITALPPLPPQSRLSKLRLGWTGIRRLPEDLGKLAQLRYLDLSGLELEDIPDWLLESGLRIHTEGPCYGGVLMADTRIKGVDMSIFDQPPEVFRQWVEERKKGLPLNEVKVVFLGDGEAGKTHTIARLLNDGGDPVGFDGEATPGVVISDKAYTIGAQNVRVHFWDFGGQEILHCMHRMFLTERTLYVIVLNARDDTQDDRARYWLHNVRSFAAGAPVLLVLNKMDQNPKASVNETGLRQLYPDLTEVVKLSAKCDSQEVFNVRFTQAMLGQIGAMENLSVCFPASWTRVKQHLQNMTANYILGSQYKQICRECGVADTGRLRRSLLHWFNDLGVSVFYSGDVHLENYVILRPNWITNAIYAILFNNHPGVTNGLLSHETIFDMIQGDDRCRRVSPGERYDLSEIDFILGVTRKFRLSFRISDGREFVPMLCRREEDPIAAEYRDDPDTLEFRMIFPYLPDNVLHRLMVELRGDLDTGHVWRTGACFRQKTSGLGAVVMSEGNVLKFYVRSGSAGYTAGTYLCILKDAVDAIRENMNLELEENQVVYKLEGKGQVFDYDALVEAQACGVSSVFSKAHRRALEIADILHQTSHSAQQGREKILNDIAEALQMLQANEMYWRVGENARNTYVRDLLRRGEYTVHDQTLSGISAGGKQAGELDLEIRKKSGEPLTIYEGLNLGGKSGSKLSAWEAHLEKLLRRYNVNGLPFLFLVSYVDVTKGAFGEVWNTFEGHMRIHSPAGCPLQDMKLQPLARPDQEEGNYIRAARCVYDCEGFPTTVYHIFVRMGLKEVPRN